MNDPVRFTRAYLERRIQELEAQCAAMREALLGTAQREDAPDGPCWCADSAWGHEPPDHMTACLEARAALATDAGKAMLERLEKAETESAGWKAAMNAHAERAEKAEHALDGVDCEWREGNGTKRCRVDSLRVTRCWRCRAEKAERATEVRARKTGGA